MEIITKKQLIRELKKIKSSGWIKNARPGNSGGVGNTIEDLLGIKENNLPIPNAAEWELKCQRAKTSSLTTLFHIEPSPRALNIVPKILLLKYGWAHKEAGKKYTENELSFRQTISAKSYSDRGFKVQINNRSKKVLITFNAESVSERHKDWLDSVKKRAGLKELNPQPYWGFDDLFHKAGTKLLNCFYLQAETKREKGVEYFKYNKILMCQKFGLEKFLIGLKKHYILVDFDARTGHNHGTKFRLKQNMLPTLYEKVTEI